nr:fused MFS/spermidine synthase [Planctomycetota bacterium]
MRARLGHLLVAGVSGFTILLLEFAAVRQLAPAFGSSNYVWANVIGVMLLGLALGYFAGGRLGERSRSGRPLYVAHGIAALYSAAAAFVGPDVCAALVPEGLPGDRLLPLAFTGSLLAALVLFAPPVFLLGMTSPFLIRLEARRGREGRTTGGLYAIGTVGSLTACYLTPLVLLQVWGTKTTVLFGASLAAALSIGGLLLVRGHSDAREGLEAPPAEAVRRVGGLYVLTAL